MGIVRLQPDVLLAQNAAGLPQPVLLGIGAVVMATTVGIAMARFKRCPADKILVVFGKLPNGETMRCYHGGGVFVWPLVQSFAYLDVQPMRMEIEQADVRNADGERMRIVVASNVAIGTDPATMRVAAERLLMLKPKQVMELAEDIFRGVTQEHVGRSTVNQMNSSPEELVAGLRGSIESEIARIGLVLLDLKVMKAEVIRTPFVAEVRE